MWTLLSCLTFFQYKIILIVLLYMVTTGIKQVPSKHLKYFLEKHTSSVNITPLSSLSLLVSQLLLLILLLACLNHSHAHPHPWAELPFVSEAFLKHSHNLLCPIHILAWNVSIIITRFWRDIFWFVRIFAIFPKDENKRC